MPTHVDLDFVIYTTPDGEIREWRYPATNDWTREQAIEEFIKVACEARLYSFDGGRTSIFSKDIFEKLCSLCESA